MRAAIVLALLFGLAAPAGAAQPSRDPVATAKALMLGGRTAEARALLLELAASGAARHDVNFLLGLLAIDAREYGQAIQRFRSILVDEPGAVRVRLELGRAFYLKHDYENAFRQFQFARAGKPAPGVVASIDRFIAAIRREKRWSYSLSLAIAPDSNINNGSSTSEVELFGLPFELGEETRSKSGVGVAMEGAVEFAPRIADNVRLRLGAAVQRRDYAGSRYDDMTIALHAGPRIVAGRWDLSAEASAFQRRLGGERLSEGTGVALGATRHLDARTAIAAGLSAYLTRYPDYPLQDGPSLSASLGAFRALTPASSASVRIGVGIKSARADEFAYRWQSVGLGYQRELAGGFSVQAEPSLALSRYEADDAFFGKRRKDRLIELRLAVLNRRIDLSGFTPRVGFTWSRRRSSIDLYDSNQRRFEFGVTRAF